MTEVLAGARPAAAALEGGFIFKNARISLVLGEVRGVVIATCAAAGVPVFEYSPRKVKQALVGTGSASKEQVARMVASRLGLDALPGEDESDALAIAICHLQHRTGYSALDSRPL
jgi:crossover junction endodeoxyribonuclease RuvC